MRRVKRIFMGFEFPYNPEAHGDPGWDNQIYSFMLKVSPKMLASLARHVRMWAFAKGIEMATGCRCVFIENDGSIKKPISVRANYEGWFVLYVSKNGTRLKTYALQFSGNNIELYNSAGTEHDSHVFPEESAKTTIIDQVNAALVN